MATLPGAWRYRVSTGTGRPGVSILWLGEVEGLICNFYLSVAARKIVRADPSLRYTSSNQPTNKQLSIFLTVSSNGNMAGVESDPFLMFAGCFTSRRHRPTLCTSDTIASLAWWLRRPPGERYTWVRFPLAPRICFRVESCQWLQHWYTSGYPARRLAL